MSITDLLVPEEWPHPGDKGGFVLGTVAENSNKDFPGMIKVEFTSWNAGENISKWLPVLSPYAGKEYGRYLIPEVGDIVLVGFIGTLREQPFVLGSFYPTGAKLPGEQFDDKNLNRHLKTKGGVKFTVRDEGGKQKIEAVTPKELTVRVEDEKETITFTDKNNKNFLQIDCKNGKITLTADKKIALKAGKCEITMDGNSGEVSIKCDQLKIEAGQSANIKSKNMMALEAGMLKVEGKQQLALKGSAICEISGGMVKIN